MRLSRRIQLLAIHHSASGRATTLEQIRSWHELRGWSDVGYHFVIEGDGTLRPGRNPNEIGAHAKGHNMHSLGVCVVGDNTQPSLAWSEDQRQSLVDFVRWFRRFYPEADIMGHRDLKDAATLCPGLDVRALLKERGAL